MVIFINNSRSSTEFAIGPPTGGTPGRWFFGKGYSDWPPKGTRSDVGLKPYIPQHSDGIRIDPAMSLPTPRGEPLNAINAPSPPVEPPAVRLVLCGLSVLPKILFSESAVYQYVRKDMCKR
jgi:hypothetical protein